MKARLTRRNTAGLLVAFEQQKKSFSMKMIGDETLHLIIQQLLWWSLTPIRTKTFSPYWKKLSFLMQESTATACALRASGGQIAPTAAPVRTAAPAPRKTAPACAHLDTAAPTAGEVNAFSDDA